MVEGGRRGLMPLATPTENTRGEGTRRNTFAYSDRGSDYTHTTYQYPLIHLYTVKRTILAALYNSFFCFRIEWVR